MWPCDNDQIVFPSHKLYLASDFISTPSNNEMLQIMREIWEQADWMLAGQLGKEPDAWSCSLKCLTTLLNSLNVTGRLAQHAANESTIPLPQWCVSLLIYDLPAFISNEVRSLLFHDFHSVTEIPCVGKTNADSLMLKAKLYTCYITCCASVFISICFPVRISCNNKM